MSTYPGAIDAFPTHVDNTEYMTAADLNNVQSAAVAIETILGVNPQGSYATVVAWLNALQSSISSGVALDTAAADIQPVGTSAVAGNAGKAADSKHVHVGVSSITVNGGTASTGAVALTIPTVVAGTTADIQPLAALAAAGGTGRFSDAGHTHSGLYGLPAQATFTGGGTITRDAANNLTWSARFLVIAEGSGSIATVGYFDIDAPPSGTVCPVDGGASGRNWGANGIQLNPYEALWYRLPIGGGSATVAGNFLVTSYTGAGLVPPSPDTILLALHNGDDDSIVVFAGQGYVLGNLAAVVTGDADVDIEQVHRQRFRVDGRQLTLSYTGSNLTGVTEKDSGGANTTKTVTLNYTGSQLTSVVEVAGGRTVTTTLSYTSGNLTGVTRSVA